MEAMTIFARRFTCRRFTDQPLSEDDLRALLEAARWAPSAGNLQPWRYVVVTAPEARRALARAAYSQDFVAEAPVVVVVCALPGESAREYGERGRLVYCLLDTGAAVENLLLAATASGLGSCWVGAFDEAAVTAALSLPADWRPAAVVPVGHRAEEPGARERKPLDQLVVFRR